MPNRDALVGALPVAQLDQLAQFVARRLGLDFPAERRGALARGARAAATESGFAAIGDYAALLSSATVKQEHLAMLASHITIGETYFFREPAGLAALQDEVLLDLVKARRAGPPGERCLRIWCAGCASGEEPYSVVMMLEAMIPDLGEWDVTVLATDVNPRFLDGARRGIYRDWSFRGMSPALKERYFLRRAEGEWEIAAHVRRRVEFACLNLAEDDFPSALGPSSPEGPRGWDVILCRNVLIYFEMSQGRRVARKLVDALGDGGGLLTGTIDAHPHFAELGIVRLPHPGLYCKRRMPTVEQPSDTGAVPRATTRPPPQKGPVATPRGRDADATEAYDLALSLFRQARYSEATHMAEVCLDRDPTAVPPKALLARIHANRGALEEAIEWSSRAIAGNRSDAEAHYRHAGILVEMGRHAEAVAPLTRAVYLAPDFALAHYALGMLANGEGLYARSRKHLDNALAILACRDPAEGVAEAEGLRVADLTDIVSALREASMAAVAS